MGPAGYTNGIPVKAKKGSAPKELVEARRYREGRLVHGIVLDPQLWPDAPEDEKAMEDLVETIGELSNSAWQVPCILVERRGAAQVSALREALSRTWERARESHERVVPMPQVVDGGIAESIRSALEVVGAAGNRAWFLSDKKIQVLPFLQTKVMSWSFQAFGVNEVSARLPSAILGLLILGLVVWLGSLLWTPRWGFGREWFWPLRRFSFSRDGVWKGICSSRPSSCSV